jgi:hypothetical protein
MSSLGKADAHTIKTKAEPTVQKMKHLSLWATLRARQSLRAS